MIWERVKTTKLIVDSTILTVFADSILSNVTRTMKLAYTKEYICKIWKFYQLPLKNMANIKVFADIQMDK